MESVYQPGDYQGDADQRSRRTRRQGRKPAPETGGQYLDPSCVQGTPHPQQIRREMTHAGGKLTSFPLPCQ